jgi:hypothetical protein
VKGPADAVEPGDDTDYTAMDSLLKGWARWAAQERGPQQPTAAGVVLQIASERDADYRVRVSDDEFTLIDSRVAQLPRRLREITELEYRGLWRGRHFSLSQEEKWRRLGVGHTAYGKRRAQAQRTLFHALKPDVLGWIGREARCPHGNRAFCEICLAELGASAAVGQTVTIGRRS